MSLSFRQSAIRREEVREVGEGTTKSGGAGLVTPAGRSPKASQVPRQEDSSDQGGGKKKESDMGPDFIFFRLA